MPNRRYGLTEWIVRRPSPSVSPFAVALARSGKPGRLLRFARPLVDTGDFALE